MYLVLPHLLTILQFILVIMAWARPGKASMVLGSLLVGLGCLYLTGFLLTSPWVLSVKALLYFIVGAVQVSYVAMALMNRVDLWRIASLSQPLMLPFLLLANYLPAISGGPAFMVEPTSLQWHVVSATLAYALLSLAAFFAFAIITRQAYLKAHARSAFVTGLPSLEVLEKAQSSTLKLTLLVLLVSVVAGSFFTHETYSVWFLLQGKSTLTLITLILLFSLLVGKRVCGVRGRQGAQLVLLVYFLVIILFGVSLYI